MDTRLGRVALILGLTLVAGIGALRIDPVVDFVDTVPEHEGLGPYRAMLQELDGVRFVAFHLPHDPAAGPHLRTDQGFDRLVDDQGRFQADMVAAFPEVDHFLSAHEAMRGAHYMFWRIASAQDPPPDRYSVPEDPRIRQQIRDDARDASADVLAADGSSALVMAFLAGDDATARATAGQMAAWAREWHAQNKHGVAPGDEQGTPVLIFASPQATGLLVTSHATDARVGQDVLVWGALSAVAVVGVLWMVLRSPLRAAVAVASLTAATLWTFGIIGWLGRPLSFLSVFLVPVVVGIGIDHAIHLLDAGRTRGPRAALRHLRAPMLLGTLTTVGVLSIMALLPAPLFAEVGLLGAVGIMMGLLAALAIAPMMPAGKTRHAPRDRLGAWATRQARRVQRHRGRAAVAVGVVCLLAAAAASQTRIESGSAENEFPQDDPQIILQHRIEEEYGAFQRAYIVFQGEITHPQVLRAIDGAVQESQGLPLWRGAASIVDLLRADGATDEGVVDIAASVSGLAGAPVPSPVPRTTGEIPDDPAEAEARIIRLQQDPMWGRLTPFLVSADRQLAVVAVQVDPWQDQDELTQLRDALVRLARHAQEAAGDHVEVAAAGSPVNRAAIVAQTPWDVGLVAAGGALSVFVVLGMAWTPRRGLEGLRAAGSGAALVAVAGLLLLAAIPLLDLAYGGLGRLGAPANNAALNDMFLLAFAVTVGLGVDDHVHITMAAWHRRDAGQDPGQAVLGAWRERGRAVTGTTISTVAAFLPLAGVYFLQSKNLAILVCVGVIAVYLLSFVSTAWALRTRRSGG